MRAVRHAPSASASTGARVTPRGRAAAKRAWHSAHSLHPRRHAAKAAAQGDGPAAPAGDAAGAAAPAASTAEQGSEGAEAAPPRERDNRGLVSRARAILGAQRGLFRGGGFSSAPSTAPAGGGGGGGGRGGPWTGRRFLGGDGGWEVRSPKFSRRDPLLVHVTIQSTFGGAGRVGARVSQPIDQGT